MEYRILGKTGLKVSALSLGTEYLIDVTRKHVTGVIHEAIDQGINYFDVFWAQPAFRDNMGAAFKGKRDKVYLAAHLGSTHQKGQYTKTRNVKKAKAFIDDFLTRYHTDYADVLFLHNSDGQKDHDRIFAPDGLYDLACTLKEQGKVRFIGFSGHTTSTIVQAAESGKVDVVMYPINLANHAVPDRETVHAACVKHNVGLVAMKPFAGGKLFDQAKRLTLSKWHTGGKAAKLKRPDHLSALQCLAYVLGQKGVSCVVPGCKNKQELAADLNFFTAPEADKDFAHILEAFNQYKPGECVYCNHCLPCPVNIDIGNTIRLSEAAEDGMTETIQNDVKDLPASPSECTECGACEKRCPFGVKTVVKIKKAAEVLIGSGMK